MYPRPLPRGPCQGRQLHHGRGPVHGRPVLATLGGLRHAYEWAAWRTARLLPSYSWRLYWTWKSRTRLGRTPLRPGRLNSVGGLPPFSTPQAALLKGEFYPPTPTYRIIYRIL